MTDTCETCRSLYPDKPLGKQIRPYSETLSVADVVKREFFGDHKPKEQSDDTE